MDLEKFCQKFDLQIDELKKELSKIMENEGITEQAALNVWKSENMSMLRIKKKGEKLRAIYLFTEQVIPYRAEETGEEPFFRAFFMVLPGREPLIAFVKLTKEQIIKLFPEEPETFSGYVFEAGYVTKGKRLNWINCLRDENGLPLLSPHDVVITNKDLHDYLIKCSRSIEEWYDENLEEEISYKYNLDCYLQVLSTDDFEWTDKQTGEKFTAYRYYLVDLVDDSLVRAILTDWRGELPLYDKYDNLYIYGGYTKQTAESDDILTISWSANCPIFILRSPSI